MKLITTSLLLSTILFYNFLSYAETTCIAPELSDKQIEEIISKERQARTDLPNHFKEYKITVHRQGCHYKYIEFGLPEKPGYNLIFTLNQYGVIVDVLRGR